MCMLEHGYRRILAIIIIMEVFLFDGQESPRFKQVLWATPDYTCCLMPGSAYSTQLVIMHSSSQAFLTMLALENLVGPNLLIKLNL